METLFYLLAFTLARFCSGLGYSESSIQAGQRAASRHRYVFFMWSPAVRSLLRYQSRAAVQNLLWKTVNLRCVIPAAVMCHSQSEVRGPPEVPERVLGGPLKKGGILYFYLMKNMMNKCDCFGYEVMK